LMKYENKILNIEDINKLIIKKAYNRNHKYSLSYENIIFYYESST
jgi:hypothetical protein